MHVSIDDSNVVATRCTLVVPYQARGFLLNGGWIAAQVWNSVDQTWVNDEVARIYEGLWWPSNVITLGNTIYFSSSQRTIFHSNVEAGVVNHGTIDVPWDAPVRPILCVHEGRLVVCRLNSNTCSIRIWAQGVG